MAGARVMGEAGVSGREAEVLDLLALRLTNAEIAARLFVSVRTVESHVSALLRKLGAADRRALAELAAGTPSAGEPVGAGILRPPLPLPLTSFVGRQAERTALATALREHRLVTAVGPGGVGKTRLALAVAADLEGLYPDGVFYVDLVPVTDPAAVPGAVAASLGVGEQRGLTADESVRAALAGATALVILDNCEHLLDAVALLVERLLSACPGVVVLATSRARLQVPFEWVYAVSGLSMPDQAGEGDAVALFVERATAVGRPPRSAEDRRRVSAICRRLDGVALAIELAAARLPATGIDGLEAGLADAMRMLAGGPRVDERHQSLRSALDWSYELLDPADRAVLRRASVFAAPFTTQAAIAVAAFGDVDAGSVPEALARLADHNLVVMVHRAGATHYRMLETIRQYGEGRLAEGREHDEARGRHLDWCRSTAAVLELGDAEGLDAVVADMRAALAWAGEQEERRPHARELSLRWALLSLGRGRPGEATRHFEQAASLAAGDVEAAHALRLAGDSAMTHMRGSEALRLFLEAAAAARRAGQHAAAAVDLARAVELVARFPGMLVELPPGDQVRGWLADARALAGGEARAETALLVAEATGADPRDPVTAHLAERAIELARRIGEPRLESAALDALCAVQLAHGDVLAGAATSRRRLDRLSPLPLDRGPIHEHCEAFHMILMASTGAGDLPGVHHYSLQRLDLALYREEGDLMVDWLMVWAALSGELQQAVALAERFEGGWERAGRPALGGIAHGPAAAALAFGLRGDDDARTDWLHIFAAMKRVVAPLASRDAGLAQIFDAVLHLHRDGHDAALAALDVDPEDLRHWHTGVWRQWYAAVWAEASVLAVHAEAPARIARARVITAGNPIAAPLVERADALANGDRRRLLTTAAALDAAGCRYQWARTLVLAGGGEGNEGRRALTAMGAAIT